MEKKNIDRRKFLGDGVLAGATVIGAGAILSSCKKEATNASLGLPPILKGAPKGRKLRAGLSVAGTVEPGQPSTLSAPVRIWK
jgi:myo-inositol 2-dehydrogenase / D-chiro-inositol 1-dehydrogenase